MTVTTDPFSASLTAIEVRQPVDQPRWLREAVSKMGQPETDTKGRLRRWLWRDGETGVVIDRQTHIWQLVVFTPRTSVTYRSVHEPDDIEIRLASNLAGLGDPWTDQAARPKRDAK
jgi:hypothetical protein